MNLYLNFYSFFYFFEIQDLISVCALCLLYLLNVRVPKTILTFDTSYKFRDPQAHLQL